MILVEAGKTSPWSRPDESEFADDFRAAAEFRAEHDRDSYMRELCETMLLDFDSSIDWSLPPIGNTLGVTYALYLKKYVAWCEEVGIRAIIADPFFVAQYLRELAEEGFTDLHGVREALRRAHWLQGHGDGTAHPRVDAVIAKYEAEILSTNKETEEVAYKPSDPKADIQGTTKFTGKIYDKQIAQADADLKVMQANKGTREIGEFIEKLDGDSSNNRLAGGPAPLPKRSA